MEYQTFSMYADVVPAIFTEAGSNTARTPEKQLFDNEGDEKEPNTDGEEAEGPNPVLTEEGFGFRL